MTTTLKLVAWVVAAWPAAWIGLLPISVTFAVKVWPGMASIVTLAGWPICHARDVGLVHVHFGLDHRHIRDRQQHRAGVVHRADDDCLALFDVAAGDDAGDRRLDADLAQVEARALGGRAFLMHPQFLRLDLLLLRPQVRLAHPQIVFCPLERFTRRQATLPQLLLPTQIVFRLLQRYPGAVERQAQLFHLRLRRLQRGLGALHRRPEVARIDLQQELILRDAVALVDGEVGDAPHRVGADVDRPGRLDLARRGNERFEPALLDRFRIDGDAFAALEVQVGIDDGAEQQHHAYADQNLLVPTQLLPPNMPRINATQTAISA